MKRKGREQLVGVRLTVKKQTKNRNEKINYQ